MAIPEDASLAQEIERMIPSLMVRLDDPSRNAASQISGRHTIASPCSTGMQLPPTLARMPSGAPGGRAQEARSPHLDALYNLILGTLASEAT